MANPACIQKTKMPQIRIQILSVTDESESVTLVVASEMPAASVTLLALTHMYLNPVAPSALVEA
eukprot:CAMPEP_0167804572 /NCGR_PEP_ID=MMETSP0111_2-20121227/20572_1 /TAXON_ID=91324 /ORGANISM="Lotharella globosa, Strain CCCM811" /LENGTH=63 /DNA_ID=CAMNT_0007701379 /DNA_START=521 /DNA_END=712 /DNA_ORIENTATION=-